MTLPGVLISVKKSIFERGVENIRRNVLFPSTAKQPRIDLFARLFELRIAVEIGGEEIRAPYRIERVDVSLIFAGAIFEDVVEGVDRRARESRRARG